MNQPLDTEQQAAALRQAAGFLRLPRRSLIEIGGADRALFLHNLCTNEVRQSPPGTGRELFATSVQGRTLAHGFALVHDNAIWLVTPDSCGPALLSHMDRYIVREDVVLRDLNDQYVELLLCGPLWRTHIPALVDLSDTWNHTRTELSGARVWLARTAWSSHPNFMLITSKADEQRIVSQLEQLGGVCCDDPWFDRLRIEAGFPEFGCDITERNLPQEIDRNQHAISFTKGCYLGQETVARLDALGHVNWRMRGVRAPLSVPLRPGLEIESAGTVIARITSAAVSPQNDRQIGLATVRETQSARGTELAWQGYVITVEDLPFADHSN